MSLRSGIYPRRIAWSSAACLLAGVAVTAVSVVDLEPNVGRAIGICIDAPLLRSLVLRYGGGAGASTAEDATGELAVTGYSLFRLPIVRARLQLDDAGMLASCSVQYLL
jgi:hypothetical protein